MESSIVEQEEAEVAEVDPLGPNRWSSEEGEEDEEVALVFFISMDD